jgi:hypothetical protein
MMPLSTWRRDRRTGRAGLGRLLLTDQPTQEEEHRGMKYPVIFSLVDGTDTGEIDEGRTD